MGGRGAGASPWEAGPSLGWGRPLLGPSQEPPLCPQVSHHPPVSAFHVSNRKDGFCISGSITAKSRFYGEGLPRVAPGPRRMGGLGSWRISWSPRPQAVAACVSLRLLLPGDHAVGGAQPGSRRSPASGPVAALWRAPFAGLRGDYGKEPACACLPELR